ncbi:Aldo/keto reductase [Aspergillus novofumigatus IBT 16806]|uniref:D-xylose reductase [NAD(P)H] n=1 Tax=Aspergillus novofumigatus (strain IBT 16806) TaxID=1392255 RepID=A0A2I1BUJ9_ASPN1|nr:Aldo/keto reductase [Aspergillus novofumigatus IBT 16806]PKX89077.1 Aldo/keto reductase [Aspergillus novofumigatus IBT 16806]
MPAVGLGTRKPRKPRQAYETVKAALAVGYRHLDSAARYNNEDQVGEAVRDSGLRREDIWVTTKVENAWHHHVAEPVDRSMAVLGFDYIDLPLVHWPIAVSLEEDPSTAMPSWEFTHTWQEMQRVLASGRVRNVGVSNFGIRNLKKLLSDPACYVVPAVNQIEVCVSCVLVMLTGFPSPPPPRSPSPAPAEFFSSCTPAVHASVWWFCQKRGIHCTAYSPLAFELPQLHESAALAELCKRTSKTLLQILIVWGLRLLQVFLYSPLP